MVTTAPQRESIVVGRENREEELKRISRRLEGERKKKVMCKEGPSPPTMCAA